MGGRGYSQGRLPIQAAQLPVWSPAESHAACLPVRSAYMGESCTSCGSYRRTAGAASRALRRTVAMCKGSNDVGPPLEGVGFATNRDAVQ